MEISATRPAEGAGGASQEPAEPHGALYLVLGYLRLPELLSVHRVCRSLRDAVAGDRLLWRNVLVEPPLSGRITDGALLEVTSRAGGALRTLALVKCWRVTDAGLQRVVQDNPGITKLHVPGCIHLTAEGVLRAVRSLAERKGNLKQLRLNGVSSITKEHLGILNSVLKVHPQQDLKPSFYGDWNSLELHGSENRPIDIDVCPKCESPRLVFDCTREKCRVTKGGHWTECRGCFFCIARCGMCAGCVGFQELGEESACSHLLCLDCWLQLPKCHTCNRPYCAGHGNSLTECSGSSGFVCEECQIYGVPFSALDL